MVLLTGSMACATVWADHSCQAPRSETAVEVSSGSVDETAVHLRPGGLLYKSGWLHLQTQVGNVSEAMLWRP